MRVTAKTDRSAVLREARRRGRLRAELAEVEDG